MAQIRLEGEDAKLLDLVKRILKDEETLKPLDSKNAIIECMQIVKDMYYQENGADVRVGKKKVNVGNF